MARRKRKEDDVIWAPPEFDEVGYMQKEIESAKIAVVVIAWAAVGAIIAYLLAVFVFPILGYLIGLVAFAALYYLLPVLGLPIHGFKRKDWISHASVYFFSWLAFSILILNPPFGDHTNPAVGSFEAGSFRASGNVTQPAPGKMVCVPVTPGSVTVVPPLSNNSYFLIFRATDNVAVRTVQVQVETVNVTPASLAGQPNVCQNGAPTTFYADTYGVRIPIVAPQFLVTVTVTDTSGLTATASVTLKTA